ncbi:hypothetical protein [Streptomyces albicerus]|jgi:hypothetical protein|uniref:hypothetical protein n=1 Tax=Streptomyces albicerus TaxID=2569859 RepID=UPI001CEC6419|nr:hypothetical protein [Streptomyces albicerus]
MSVSLIGRDKLTLLAAVYGAGSQRPALSGTCSRRSRRAGSCADQVLPALTAAMSLPKKQDPAEADSFRGTVSVAIEAAARAHTGEPQPCPGCDGLQDHRPLGAV